MYLRRFPYIPPYGFKFGPVSLGSDTRPGDQVSSVWHSHAACDGRLPSRYYIIVYMIYLIYIYMILYRIYIHIYIYIYIKILAWALATA